MKKFLGVSMLFLFLGFSQASEAQSKVKKAGQEVKKGAKKVGNKTAEVASKGKARATDQVHKDKVGPNGETIYMDNHARYYWVDKHGRRHYLPEEALKNKIEE
ncbi:MAG TPA: hypothetical protein VGB46_09365 [Flavisolibacter sp.]|jgi:hypothetical protein